MDNRREFYISIMALLVSFFAAGFSYWQLIDARQHNRISVRPILIVTAYMEGPGGRNGVYLSNEGLGPGILTSMDVQVKGKSYAGLGKNQWVSVLNEAGTIPGCFKHGWPADGAVVQPGADLALLVPTAAKLPHCDLAAMLLQMQKVMELSLGYQSLYGEAFTSSGSAKINVDF